MTNQEFQEPPADIKPRGLRRVVCSAIKLSSKQHEGVQGFIDQNGVFMGRIEARKVAEESGQQIFEGDLGTKQLYSENLY